MRTCRLPYDSELESVFPEGSGSAWAVPADVGAAWHGFSDSGLPVWKQTTARNFTLLRIAFNYCNV